LPDGTLFLEYEVDQFSPALDIILGVDIFDMRFTVFSLIESSLAIFL